MDLTSAHWRAKAQRFAVRNHRRIVIAIAASLGVFTATAFGIAPLMPDPAVLPQRLLVEAIETPGLGQQVDVLAALPLDLRRSTVTRSTDSAEALLIRLGVSDAIASAFMRHDPLARRILQGRGGKLVQALADANGSLQQLVARYPADKPEERQSRFVRLTIEKVDGRWTSRAESAPLETTVRLGSGTIRTSLFAATDEAGLPDAIATQLAEIFAADIDFHRQLRRGDSFNVIYEVLSADGEVVPWNEGAGRVLAAEFVSNGKAVQALWFVDREGRGGYFGPDGQSRRKAFLASPLEFSRVTSGFAMRFHPLMQSWRAHLGVDYGAPSGTPVRAVGEGVVEFAGVQNGYGNVVEVRHAGDRSTLYAHLSRVHVRKGQRIEQGQQIGDVGATGWATGPHLHFEFRVGGRHQDPLTLARAVDPMPPLDAHDRGRFGMQVSSVRDKLEIAESLAGTRTIAE